MQYNVSHATDTAKMQKKERMAEQKIWTRR